MRHLIIIAVRVYWLVWPRHLNRGCIYRETCSHHVYRIASESGFAAGLRALRHRFQTCRPGYTASTDASGLGLVLRDGSFLPKHLVAEDIFTPIQHTITQLEKSLSNEAADGLMRCSEPGHSVAVAIVALRGPGR